MKTRLYQKLAVFFYLAAFLFNLSIFANKLTIDNQTKYYIWVKNLEYSGPFWVPGREDTPAEFQPVPPKTPKSLSWVGYAVGYLGRSGIRYHISSIDDWNDAKNRYIDEHLKSEAAPKSWQPFYTEDMNKGLSTTPLLTFTQTTIRPSALTNQTDYTVTITEKPSDYFTPQEFDEANSPENQKYYKFNDNSVKFKNSSKDQITLRLNQTKPVNIPAGETIDIQVRDDKPDFVIDMHQPDFKNPIIITAPKKVNTQKTPLSVISKSDPKTTYKGTLNIKSSYFFHKTDPQRSKVSYEVDLIIQPTAPALILKGAESITPMEKGRRVDTSKIDYTNNQLTFNNKSKQSLVIVINDKDSISLNANSAEKINISTSEDKFTFTVKIPSYSSEVRSFSIPKNIQDIFNTQQEIKRETGKEGFSDILIKVIPAYYLTQKAILKTLASGEKPWAVNYTIEINVNDR